MFLHSGASLHGHEYSNRSAPDTKAAHALRSPLLRSTFAASSKSRRDSVIEAPLTPPALRRRPDSDYSSRIAEPIVRFKEPEYEDVTLVTDMHDNSAEDLNGSDVMQSSTATAPVSGSQAKRRRRRRGAPRKTTQYSLGYPTPKILGKTKVVQSFRQRLLLQLQQVGQDGRRRPVLEVYPSSRIAGPVGAPRFGKMFPAMFGVKRQLGHDDMVLVRRDDHDLNAEDGSGSDLEQRSILAVYSPTKNSKTAEIVLDNGSIWVASPSRNNSFDFVHVDAQGQTTTARWARRNFGSTTSSTETQQALPDQRFTFSVISPLSRRHPVMATLTQTSLEVQDSYTSICISSGQHLRVRDLSQTGLTYNDSIPKPTSDSQVSSADGYEAGAVFSGPETERLAHIIDEPTKNLISVTALWVALASGWSSAYAPPLSGSESPTSGTLVSNRPCRYHTWTRQNTSDADISLTASKRFTLPASLVPDKRASSPALSMSQTSSGSGATASRVLSRRATSTGAAYMQQRIKLQEQMIAAHPEAGTAVTAATGFARPVLGTPTSDCNTAAQHIAETSPPDLPVDPSDSDVDVKADVVEQAGRPREHAKAHQWRRSLARPIVLSSASHLSGRAGGCADDTGKGFRVKLAKWLHKIRYR